MRRLIFAALAALPPAGPALGQDYEKAWELMAQMRFIERNCPSYRLQIADPNVEKLYGAAGGTARVMDRLKEAEAAAERDASVKMGMCKLIASQITGPAVFVRSRCRLA